MRDLAPGRVTQKPTGTAILTTLVCNAVLAVGLATWFLIASGTSPAPSDAGEDWTGVIFVIVLMVFGTVLAVGTAIGAAASAILVGRSLRRAATRGQLGITKRTAIKLGSAGTAVGWVIGVAVGVSVPIALAWIPTLTG